MRTALVLFLAGMLTMAGDVLGLPAVRGLGIASGAAPAPKVFSTVRGLETFSSRFRLHVAGAEGSPRIVELTPELYRRLDGPYLRRNAWGAALAYGPVLLADPATRAMIESVLRSGFCDADPAPGTANGSQGRRALLARETRVGPVCRIEVVPRTGTAPDLPMTIFDEEDCP